MWLLGGVNTNPIVRWVQTLNNRVGKRIILMHSSIEQKVPGKQRFFFYL